MLPTTVQSFVQLPQAAALSGAARVHLRGSATAKWSFRLSPVPATPAHQKANALPGQNAFCVSLLMQPSTVRIGKEKAFHDLR